MLEKIKLSLRIATDDFNDEIMGLIEAAFLDLGITDITPQVLEEPDALIGLAVTTYVKMHFGEPDEYERLKRSYDEQKAQLLMSSGYTDWGGVNG